MKKIIRLFKKAYARLLRKKTSREIKSKTETNSISKEKCFFAGEYRFRWEE